MNTLNFKGQVSVVRLNDLRNKRVGVVLSSSFFGFYAHAGFVKVLDDLGIEPCAYSGSSAGALISAMVAAGISPDQMRDILMSLRKDMFWDPDYVDFMKGLCRFFKGWSGLLRGEALKDLLDRHLPVKTFEECRLPCCIVASNISDKCRKVFTQGSIIDAVHASLAVPGLFRAVVVDGKYYVDGGFVSKAPVLELYEMAKPEVILVHYLAARTLNGNGKIVLSNISTHKISAQASSIGRHLSYRLQCDYVRTLGCEVVEISPETTMVSPNKLEKGKIAFQESQVFARRFLESMN